MTAVFRREAVLIFTNGLMKTLHRARHLTVFQLPVVLRHFGAHLTDGYTENSTLRHYSAYACHGKLTLQFMAE